MGWSGRNGVTYNAGATWNQVLGPQFGYVPQMQVLADPIIPEPASLFLVFPAGIALLLARKLRRSQLTGKQTVPSLSSPAILRVRPYMAAPSCRANSTFALS